mmetsp:Transcript_80865/g.143201  ORF Transcript_80865/g.143201 Transcript_80865/m.143201 type:complete len:1486 (+) Transcript_80865:71-4528(+)
MASEDSLADVLTKLKIEPEFHPLLEELCSGVAEYLTDIAADDLEGREDANGSVITASVAQDLLSKLKQSPEGAAAPSIDAEAVADVAAEASAETPSAPCKNLEGICSISFLQSSAAEGSDAGLVRCALSGVLPKGDPRCKVLAVVLDRSGSMAGSLWNRVVEGVVSVVTDDLLVNPTVSIALVVYADSAKEVPLPASSLELRDLLLSREFKPQGGTCFKAAFELTQRVLKRELTACKDRGFKPKDVDLATLVFTDGEDTSIKRQEDAVPEPPAGDDDEEAPEDEGVAQFVAFTGADERTAQYYIETSARRGFGIEESISYFFERGAAPVPRDWQPDPSGRSRVPVRRPAHAARERVTVVDKEASLTAARKAGDAFRKNLVHTGCANYLCVAAFGADHNPEQCQYISDRYYYINRGEVLADVLAGSLGALLNSAGQCSLCLRLPSRITLDEPLLESLPLDSSGHLDHHIWLRTEGDLKTVGGEMAVDVEVASTPVLQGKGRVACAGLAASDSFEGHLFLIDLVALQLRRIARELCGKRPSPEELNALRRRLTDAKERLKPTKDAASVAVGHLRGRAALRQRLLEVEAARERLSYALGQFDDSDTNDDRQIGAVAIDAILRDAGQHVPQGPLTADLARQALALANLPAPEALSKYGREYTTDSYSCCDASELASQGDALFFQLGGIRCGTSGEMIAAEDSHGFIGGEAFVLLSRNGKQAVRSTDVEAGSFTHLGIPLYVTPGHFLRVRELLPGVLQRMNASGTYKPGVSERQLLSLLGRYLAAGPSKSEAHLTALLHKARAVHAVLASTMVKPPPGITSAAESSLLDVVLAEATCFLEKSSERTQCTDLHAVAAASLLVESWRKEEFEHFGKALVEEALRRRVAQGLSGSGEAKRLCFAWGLLGPEDGDGAWLDKVLPCPEAGELSLEDRSFNPFTAADELVALESKSPGCAAPRPAGAAALLSMLSSKRADLGPLPSTWASLRWQLSAWGRTVEAFGGAGSMWRTLDMHMTEENPSHLEAVQKMVTSLHVPSSQTRPCLRQAFDDPAAVVTLATSVCFPVIEDGKCLRHVVADALRSIVARRRALVCKYPISGADFPELQTHSKESVAEIWGAPAQPMDAALHHKAMLRVWRRTMGVRLSMTTKEALADKEYRKRGGKFKFPSPLDTFIRGLHRRTSDLHEDWTNRLQKSTSGDAAREEAVAEMLLRLRWDDTDDKARTKLSQIVARIWDGLEGVDLTDKPPLSSALWLDDSIVQEEAESVEESPKEEAKPVEESPKEEAKPVEEAPAEEEEDSKPAEEAPEEKEEPEDEAAEEEEEPAYEASPPPALVKGKGKGFTLAESVPPALLKGMGKGAGMVKGKGKGKGKGKDGFIAFRASVEGAEAASAAMDAGLQAAFDGLPADLRRRMSAFVADRAGGRKVKLPWTLKAKQRKALHLWAEMQGLEHRSFGYRGKRRLHLTVPSVDGEEHDGEEEEDWEGEEDSEGED